MKMIENPKSLSCRGSIFLLKGEKNIIYTVNEEENPQEILVQLPLHNRPKSSNEIIWEAPNAVNGFKIVQLSNKEYGYKREKDNKLLPVRYDIVTNFNEHGFAMVGKDGNVTWINKKFHHLNNMGEMIPEKEEKWDITDGWQAIYEFKGEKAPLSKVYDSRNLKGNVAYFSKEGTLKDFYCYQEEIDEENKKTFFLDGGQFDGTGHTLVSNGDMLFSSGYYLPREELLKRCLEKGFINTIQEESEVIGNIPSQKKLVR